VRVTAAVIGFAVLAIAAIIGLVFFGDRLAPRTDRYPVANQAPPPPRPAVPAAADATPVKPAFDAVRVGGDCVAVLSGKAQPGALVTVKTAESELGRVTADERGEWTLVPDLPLRGGQQELSLWAALPGQAPVAADAAVTVAVPDCDRRPASGEQAVAVLSPNKGAGNLLPANASNIPGATKDLRLERVDYDDTGNLSLRGRAPPGTLVQVYVNNEPLGTAKANRAGVWRFLPVNAVPPGVYTLRIDQVAGTGKIASRLELPIAREDKNKSRPGRAASGGSVVVQPGDSLARIAKRHYGDANRANDILRANKSAIGDANRIYPGQILILP
jgi:nucleoid-associated protein YgaU